MYVFVVLVVGSKVGVVAGTAGAVVGIQVVVGKWVVADIPVVGLADIPVVVGKRVVVDKWVGVDIQVVAWAVVGIQAVAWAVVDIWVVGVVYRWAVVDTVADTAAVVVGSDCMMSIVAVADSMDRNVDPS